MGLSIVCCHGFAPADNKEAHSHSHTPPLWWVGEENPKKKAKLVGWDKDSLTQQQRKQTITTVVLIKIIHKAREYTEQFSHCPMPSMLLNNN